MHRSRVYLYALAYIVKLARLSDCVQVQMRGETDRERERELAVLELNISVAALLSGTP